MNNSSLTLFVEINDYNIIFFIGDVSDQNNFKVIYELKKEIEGIKNSRISDFETAFNLIKKNIYLVEQKVSHTFKEIILILDNFNPTFISLTGFKKLNGSQVLRENITYILNSLKSYVNKIETKKTILHIFNSKFFLDYKKIENLPIGLFGDFYSHELAFVLIDTNDQKNLKNIFSNCNLKIKKILLKSFIKSSYINEKENLENFFHLELNENNTKIFYFEDNALKFQQNFKFGSEIVINDITKITSLKKDTVRRILNKVKFEEETFENDLIEKDHFSEDIYKKIKKKLIYDIALARINEIFELTLLRNINLKRYNKKQITILFENNNFLQLPAIKEIFKKDFLNNCNFKVKFLEPTSSENMLNTAYKIVHFGWKKEAIPVQIEKKSLIARFFDLIFN